MRKDHDLLGDIYIPDEVYYGAQTQRALLLCNPSKEKLCDYPELIYCIAAIKRACAYAHEELGALPKDKAAAIKQAAEEVIANRANELLCGEKGDSHIHGNTHVNMGVRTLISGL